MCMKSFKDSRSLSLHHYHSPKCTRAIKALQDKISLNVNPDLPNHNFGTTNENVDNEDDEFTFNDMNNHTVDDQSNDNNLAFTDDINFDNLDSTPDLTRNKEYSSYTNDQ